MSTKETESVSKEVHNLLGKDAIKIVNPLEQGYYSNLFIVPQKGQRLEACHNLEISECLLENPTLQDGMHSEPEGYPDPRGLYGQAGSPRRLPTMHREPRQYLG